MELVLKVESLSKRFWIKRNRPATLKESFIQRVTGRYDKGNPFWALRDVSFSIAQGRALGVIGHNGAGKSTLLRLVCGLGRPTTGRIYCQGHAGTLLELGTGFHPDLTGRENLMTGGILSGLSRRQVRAKEEEIISFAELEEFIGQPVRTYSSGMYLRLAFASAIHFDPDLLVIDEVLAVGDARFRQKCLERLQAFRRSGKSLLLTSHEPDQIRALCDEVIVLEEGRCVMQSEPESALQCYHGLMRQRTERRKAMLAGGAAAAPEAKAGARLGTMEAEIRVVRIFDGRGQEVDGVFGGEPLSIEMQLAMKNPVSDMALTLGIYSEEEFKCFESSVPSVKATFGPLGEQGIVRCQFPEVPLLPGCYYVNVGLYPPDWGYIYDYHWQMHILHVLSGKDGTGASGLVAMKPIWSAAGKY